MSDLFHLADFLDPVDLFGLSYDSGYKDGQIGRAIKTYTEEFPDLTDAQIIFVGCGEERGQHGAGTGNDSADAIRHQLYNLYYWHRDIGLADVGNVKRGSSLTDSYSALKTVVAELVGLGKTVVILGGSHDLTLAQYEVYVSRKTVIEVTCVDAVVDISLESPMKTDHFLMEMLTAEPNYIKNYSHLGFQSYLVHPDMLETMDKLRFDCYRLGHVREQPEEVEPVIRNSHLVSIDISALSHAAAPSNQLSPNGFNGEEICTLTRYAGMSTKLSTLGIYGYNADLDVHELTAKQIAQMIWYFIDGKHKGAQESSLEDRDSFMEYHTSFSEVDTVFLQSRKTGRWWMQLPNSRFIACSYQDYVMASSNETPERWLRALERE